MEWRLDEHGISYRFEDQIVRVKVDQPLMEYLRGEEKHDALHLAQWLREAYQEEMGQALQIDEDSLAVEILVHAYLDVLFCNSSAFFDSISENFLEPLVRLSEKMHGRTEVIDCGERAVDSNRVLFDGLAKFHGAIYGILGKYA